MPRFQGRTDRIHATEARMHSLGISHDRSFPGMSNPYMGSTAMPAGRMMRMAESCSPAMPGTERIMRAAMCGAERTYGLPHSGGFVGAPVMLDPAPLRVVANGVMYGASRADIGIRASHYHTLPTPTMPMLTMPRAVEGIFTSDDRKAIEMVPTDTMQHQKDKKSMIHAVKIADELEASDPFNAALLHRLVQTDLYVKHGLPQTDASKSAMRENNTLIRAGAEDPTKSLFGLSTAQKQFLSSIKNDDILSDCRDDATAAMNSKQIGTAAVLNRTLVERLKDTYGHAFYDKESADLWEYFNRIVHLYPLTIANIYPEKTSIERTNMYGLPHTRATATAPSGLYPAVAGGGAYATAPKAPEPILIPRRLLPGLSDPYSPSIIPAYHAYGTRPIASAIGESHVPMMKTGLSRPYYSSFAQSFPARSMYSTSTFARPITSIVGESHVPKTETRALSATASPAYLKYDHGRLVSVSGDPKTVGTLIANGSVAYAIGKDAVSKNISEFNTFIVGAITILVHNSLSMSQLTTGGSKSYFYIGYSNPVYGATYNLLEGIANFVVEPDIDISYAKGRNPEPSPCTIGSS
jgi:hypothetical protein